MNLRLSWSTQRILDQSNYMYRETEELKWGYPIKE